MEEQVDELAELKQDFNATVGGINLSMMPIGSIIGWSGQSISKNILPLVSDLHLIE